MAVAISAQEEDLSVASCASYALLAQLAEQRIFNPKVVGSSPSWRTNVLRVAQLVRAPDCGSGGRRFKPAHAPHILRVAQWTERRVADPEAGGSNPLTHSMGS